MMKWTRISCFFTATLALATHAKKCERPPETGSACTYIVFARDYQGLDGCGMMLVQPDGTRLLATNLDEQAPNLKDGEMATIGFETLDDMASICMAEKAIVRLTCFSSLQQRSACPEMVDPYQEKWSEEVMKAMDPRMVESISIGNIKAFRFTSSSDVQIYACQGQLLCTYRHSYPSVCAEFIEHVRDAKVIYVVNE
jgi:hypothetical protein